MTKIKGIRPRKLSEAYIDRAKDHSSLQYFLKGLNMTEERLKDLRTEYAQQESLVDAGQINKEHLYPKLAALKVCEADLKTCEQNYRSYLPSCFQLSNNVGNGDIGLNFNIGRDAQLAALAALLKHSEARKKEVDAAVDFPIRRRIDAECDVTW